MKNFSFNIFIIYAKYEKSRDENGQETESGGSSPPGGMCPPQAAPPCGETTPELVSIPVSSCDFVSMFNFHLYNPPGIPEVCISCFCHVFVSSYFYQEIVLSFGVTMSSYGPSEENSIADIINPYMRELKMHPKELLLKDGELQI
jgi:hypothetical protein